MLSLERVRYQASRLLRASALRSAVGWASAAAVSGQARSRRASASVSTRWKSRKSEIAPPTNERPRTIPSSRFDGSVQARVACAQPLRDHRAAIEIEHEAGLVARAVVGGGDVVPRAGSQQAGVGGAGFDGSAVVADQPEADLPRGNVGHPAAVAVARVLLAGDGIVLFLLRGYRKRMLMEKGFSASALGVLAMVWPSAFSNWRRLGEIGGEGVFGVFRGVAPWVRGGARGATVRRPRRRMSPASLHLSPDRREARVLLFPGGAVGGARHQQDRRRVGDVAVHHLLRRVAEEGAERVEVLLRDRVELVIVASGAAHGQAEPDGAHGLGAILGVDFGVFLVDDAAFVGGDVAALEAGGDELIERRVGQQVAGELFDGELVERQVAVEGVDHPVAVRPDFAVVVDMHAVRVAVAGGVEPVARAVFAVVGRGEVAIHHALVGVGRSVLEEGFDFGGLGRQAGGIESDAADEGALVFGGGGGEALFFELRQDEAVDRIADPRRRCVVTAGGFGLTGGWKAQCSFQGAPAIDPALEQRDLRRGQPLAGVGRRHAEGWRPGR